MPFESISIVRLNCKYFLIYRASPLAQVLMISIGPRLTSKVYNKYKLFYNKVTFTTEHFPLNIIENLLTNIIAGTLVVRTAKYCSVEVKFVPKCVIFAKIWNFAAIHGDNRQKLFMSNPKGFNRNGNIQERWVIGTLINFNVF